MPQVIAERGYTFSRDKGKVCRVSILDYKSIPEPDVEQFLRYDSRATCRIVKCKKDGSGLEKIETVNLVKRRGYWMGVIATPCESAYAAACTYLKEYQKRYASDEFIVIAEISVG